MMAQPQQRTVRFMPVRREDAPEPTPMFSPTQVNTKESVLHSVFSPSSKYKQARTSNYNSFNFFSGVPENSNDAFSSQPTSSSLLGSSPNRGRGNLHQHQPPKGNINTNSTGYNFGSNNHQQQRNYRSAGSTAKSPSPRGNRRTAHTGGGPTLSVNTSPTSTITNEVFFSPQSTLGSAISPLSTASGLTSKSTSSFKALRDVTLLDVENIEKCNSVDDLENVIHVLDGEGRFQALLRKARTRLATILEESNKNARFHNVTAPPAVSHENYQQQITQQQKQQPAQVTHDATNSFFGPPGPSVSAPPPPPPPPPPTSSLSLTEPLPPTRITTMSSSGSLGQPQYAIQLEPNNISSTNGARTSPAAVSEGASNNDLNESNESSLVMSLSSSMLLDPHFDEQTGYALPTPNSTSSRNKFAVSSFQYDNRRRGSPSAGGGHEKALSDELKRLTETVLAMETARAADRKLFLEKLVSLESKHNKKDGSIHTSTNQGIKTIENMIEKSTASTHQLLSSLEQLRAESKELHETVKAERQAWDNTFRDAQQLESRLCLKAEELTERLTSQPTAAAREKDALLQRHKEQIAQKDRENQQLANNLRETLENLLVGLGRNKNELQHMSRTEQKEIVTSITKKSLSSTAATESLAREMAQLEKERMEASRAKEAVSAQLQQSKRAQMQLERENMQLSQKIQRLTEEVKDMTKYIAELSSNNKPKEEWEKQESRYQEIIRSLKSQLRKEETMVSVGLYRAAMDSAREKGSEVEQTKTELQSLKMKYSNLELQLYEKQKIQDAINLTRKQQAAEKEETKQRIAALQSELERERNNREQAMAKAQEESKRHKSTINTVEQLRDEVADLKWELQESGSNFKTPLRIGVQKPGPQTTTKLSSPSAYLMSPKTTTRAPINNKENPPTTATKRSKFNFVAENGGRKGLRNRLQKMRSPRSCQIMM